jgi:uncharacterized membrane protein YfhO
LARGENDALNKTMEIIRSEKGFSNLVIEEAIPPAPQNCDNLQTSMNIISQTDRRIEINLNTPVDGWFFAANTFYPGWKAFLDSNPVPLLHSDYLFMAIKIPQGFHQIIFTYTPFSFFAGFIITVSVLFLMLAIGLWWGYKQKKNGE